ncbi:penicillin-binding protein, partial [bacterium]
MEMDSRPINNHKKRKKIRWTPVLYIILAFGSGSFIGFNLWIIRSLPQIDILKNYYPVLATRLYDRNGEHVRDVYLVRRIPVLLDSIPENLQKAVISIEDKAFYRHHGLNYKRIVKAIIVDIIKRKKVQGASTITQQLARNILLSLEKSWIRKISEMYLAIELERYYTKKD